MTSDIAYKIKSELKPALLIASISLTFIAFNRLGHLIHRITSTEVFYSLFLTQAEFEAQLGYITAIFIHVNSYHLFSNIAMICAGLFVVRHHISSKYVLIIVTLPAISAMVGYSYVADLINYTGTAAGSSGASFGILASCVIARIENPDVWKVLKYSIVPFMFFTLEVVRFFGLKSSIFVSTSPMTNIAHMFGICVGYILIVSYVFYDSRQ